MEKQIWLPDTVCFESPVWLLVPLFQLAAPEHRHTYRHKKYFWQFSECCLLNNYFIKAYTRDLHQSNQVEMQCKCKWKCIAWYYLPKELGKASVLTKSAGLHVCMCTTPDSIKETLRTLRQDWLYTDGCCLLISPISGMDCCSVSMPDVIDMHP